LHEATQCDPARCVIAMAASVGGLMALSVILGDLPADVPAAIAIVMHLAPDHKSILAEILSRRTHLEVKQAQTGDVLCHSRVFVAPLRLFQQSGWQGVWVDTYRRRFLVGIGKRTELPEKQKAILERAEYADKLFACLNGRATMVSPDRRSWRG